MSELEKYFVGIVKQIEKLLQSLLICADTIFIDGFWSADFCQGFLLYSNPSFYKRLQHQSEQALP